MKINKKTIIAIVIPVSLIGLAVMVYSIFTPNAPEENFEYIGAEQAIEAPEFIGNYDNNEEPEYCKWESKIDEYTKSEDHLKNEKEDEMFWKNKKKDETNEYSELIDPADIIECTGRTKAMTPGANYVEYEVIAPAETKAEAKRIAVAIGGTLTSFSHGIAVYQIPVTVAELMQKLEEENKTDLGVQPNFIYTTFGGIGGGGRGHGRNFIIEEE